MANFDALRPAISGPLSYISMPKLPPAELLFCCNFIDGIDLSRYAGSVVITGGAKDTTTYALPGIKNGPSVTISLGKEFKRDEPWSMDFIIGKTSSVSCQFATAGLYLQADATAYSPGGVWVDNSRIIGRGAYESAEGMLQWGYRYDGAKVYYYCQGAVNGTGGIWTGTLSSASSNTASITPPSTGGYGGYTLIAARIIQKAIGTPSTYPTTNALYTGYEPLNGGGVILPRSSKFTPRRRRIAPVAVMGGRA